MDAEATTASSSSSTAIKLLESEEYDKKVRINQWHDKMMAHKKILFASELKMYQLELLLSDYGNTNKLRWSVRNCEIPNTITHETKIRRRRCVDANDNKQPEFA